MNSIKVTNIFLESPQWYAPEACSFQLLGNGVDVWKIAVSDNAQTDPEMLALLSTAEFERCSRFYRETDRNRFVTSRWAMKNIAGKYLRSLPAELVFGSGKNNKPFVKDAKDFHYSMSHSNHTILLAIANCEIGADIEFIDAKFGYREVLKDNFSVKESEYIIEKESISRFFTAWTRKEAITKATAQGLDCDLKLLPGLDGEHYVPGGIIDSSDDWVIRSFYTGANYMSSVATPPHIRDLSFFNFG
ncbi:MAG TPA: 4'-phosphopantetheinyl transferase superfamily protein [Mucilaginibacter sp.]|nr:4'-phosphopantetheinyl transferase superfamily protein [Mucilaginibacter sp.]